MLITLKWKFIKYEIDFETWKAAKTRITDNPELQSEAQAGLDREDANFCQLKIKEAVAHLNDMLHRFVNFSNRTAGNDAITGLDKQWQFDLTFNGRRSINPDSLASEMHHYVAYYVLREWSKLALPDMHQAYDARCVEERERITTLVYRKDAPLLADIDEDAPVSPEMPYDKVRVVDVSEYTTPRALMPFADIYTYGGMPVQHIGLRDVSAGDHEMVICVKHMDGSERQSYMYYVYESDNDPNGWTFKDSFDPAEVSEEDKSDWQWVIDLMNDEWPAAE